MARGGHSRVTDRSRVNVCEKPEEAVCANVGHRAERRESDECAGRHRWPREGSIETVVTDVSGERPEARVQLGACGSCGNAAAGE